MKSNRLQVDRLTGLALTGIRVVIGIFWLLQLTWKPPPTFGCPDQGFCLWLDKEIQHPLIPLYGQMLAALVKPQVYLFGWLTTIIETAVGLSLLLGVWTRLGGLIGTLWSLNLLIGLASVPGEPAWYYVFLILLNFLYLAIGASAQLAVDRTGGSRTWWARAD